MEDDVISLSSDSSRPCSPFIDASAIFNDSEKLKCPMESTVTDKQVDPFVNLISDNGTENIPLLKTISSLTNSPSKGRAYHDLSDSDGSVQEDVLMFKGNDNENYDKCFRNKASRQMTNEVEKQSEVAKLTNFSLFTLNKNESSIQSKKRKSNSLQKRKGGDLENVKLTKEQRLEEKHRKQVEKERKKAEKLAAQQIKPGNCMKHMTVSLDSSLVNCSFGGALLAAIQNSECKHNVSSSAVPYSATWRRDLPESKYQDEKDIVLIWPWQNFIQTIKSRSLCSQIQDISILNPGKSITLTIFGLNGYYSYLKTKRKGQKNAGDGQEYPLMTRREIEEELIELQIMHNCNHRLIESADELGQFIVQVTKAIAEIPFKREKQKRDQEKLEWFAAGDNRDCVSVDRAGNGLMRLWQQQLCQFNLAGHDVAQAIASVHPSPAAIMRAYDKCTSQKEGEDLLKDIAVRRCQGPLSTSRRIGPELSKKVYMFFNSTNGDAPFSQ